MPREALEYFAHKVHYDCTNTLTDLEGSGIRCPDIYEYLDVMIRFAIENEDVVPHHGLN
jgi:hypothetical protein